MYLKHTQFLNFFYHSKKKVFSIMSHASDDLERRPNPPGWRPPRAPYNPFDPDDQRPAKGYPSEYNQPISKDWRIKAGENPNYRQFVDRMRQAAFPGSAPASDYYPNRFKVLRRLRPGSFINGIHYASVLLCSSLVIYGTFFYRWNEGFDNVFSGPYRFQLRVKRMFFGQLSQQETQDLKPNPRGQVQRQIDSGAILSKDFQESDWAAERARRGHRVDVDKAIQEHEEQLLRQRQTDPSASATVVVTNDKVENSKAKNWYQFWK
ncbi:hypothetical protein V1514DRAFT_323342 [Lipomyces japonicus]|uniref:uncharacterized protein n=1 Tax=Lipomyces japonicus TaxID=56871 RepID=UPI0034CE43F0